MLYFFHHYELPVILQQAHLRQIILRNTQREVAVRPLPPPRAATAAGVAATNPLTARITQLLSTLRSTATTQTSATVIQTAAAPTVAVSHVATSTSVTTTVTVGTTAQPATLNHASQTTPATVESAAAQTTRTADTAVAASQTVEAQGRRPSGGSDEPPAPL